MTDLAKDKNGSEIQCLRPGATEVLSPAGGAVAASAVGAGVSVLRVVADADIHYSLDGTATATDVYLPSGTVEFISASKGDVLSVIGTASVYVTSMV